VTRARHAGKPQRAHRPNTAIFLSLAALVLVVGAGLWLGIGRSGPPSRGGQSALSVRHPKKDRRGAVTAPSTTTTTTTLPDERIPSGPPSDDRHLALIDTIGGPISPKSVDASQTGLVFAQNMMYRHTMTVYRSDGSYVATIPDTVDLSSFGIPGHPGITHGAPVEAAFTPDGRYAYVSNYSMYGSGSGPEGSDTCTPASAAAAGDTDSYVYRIDVQTLKIDQVIQVGLVPKFLAVTPDDRYVLVSNWCSFNLSIIDVATAQTVATLPIGAYPRGIAISPDSSTAYVAVMGGDQVEKISMATLSLAGSFTVGENPRHLVMDPAGRYLYASLNAPGDVVKIDLSDDQVVATVHTGSECRSLAISADGLSLYVVNYLSDTMTKLRSSDLSVLQTVPTGQNPVGITYDRTTGDVWVAVYTGQILVYADQ
jgi:YVTN family beta-propeller protein